MKEDSVNTKNKADTQPVAASAVERLVSSRLPDNEKLKLMAKEYSTDMSKPQKFNGFGAILDRVIFEAEKRCEFWLAVTWLKGKGY